MIVEHDSRLVELLSRVHGYGYDATLTNGTNVVLKRRR
jgi:hypothetical protein